MSLLTNPMVTVDYSSESSADIEVIEKTFIDGGKLSADGLTVDYYWGT